MLRCLRTCLCAEGLAILALMALPQNPVTLTPEQIGELNEKLSKTRHDVNNCLSLIVAAIELTRRKPELAARMTDTIAQQPDKIILTAKAKHRINQIVPHARFALLDFEAVGEEI